MTQRSTSYTIREFESGDRASFRELYETVFGAEQGTEWFDWKYRENPYVDHVPIIVATNGHDRIVGARPFLALALQVTANRELALQPCDTMVHPDHRRQGLFTRMTARAVERYADHEAALFFNFPNWHSQGGYEKLGWKPIGHIATRYRLHRLPRRVGNGSTAERFGGAVVRTVQRAYLGIRDALTKPPSGTTVSKHDQAPVDALLTLYRDAAPDEIHVLRDEQFWSWRFDNPDWIYRYYLVHESSEPVAGAVVGRKATEPGHVRLTDVVPVTPSDDTTAALLATVIDDHPDADAILAPPTLPKHVCTAFGFLSDTRLPLSAVSSPTTLVARPATREADSWPASVRPAQTLANWSITFAEQDTS